MDPSDPMRTRSGKSVYNYPDIETGMPNPISVDSTPISLPSVITCAPSLPCNPPFLPYQHHNPEAALTPSLKFQQTPSNELVRPTVDQELLEAELAIKMQELEIKKLRLNLRRQALSRQDNAENKESSYQRDSGNSVAESSFASEQQTCPPITTPREHPNTSNACTALRIEGLPKIEIDKFDGDPLKFCKFIKSFVSNIADRVTDDRQRLLYLMHYCCGNAKEAIEHCIFLSDETGYQKAMTILKSQFGRSHDIVQSFLNELLNGERIVPNDIDALRKLTRQMINCELALSQLGRTAELNCSTTLKHLVERLPRVICQKWAEKADELLSLGREPAFLDLVSFLEKYISVASSCYGLIANAGKVTNNRDGGRGYTQVIPSRSNIFASESTISCPQCTRSHYLPQCNDFSILSHNKKLEFLKLRKLCFNCLQPNHRASKCRKPTRCAVDGCNQKHHHLLHLNKAEDAFCPDAKVNSMHTERTKSYLGFVATRVIGPLGAVDTYALLDNGSDSTLITESLARRLGIEGKQTQIEVTSVHGTYMRRTSAVSFSIQSLSNQCSIDVDRAYTVQSLPLSRAAVPEKSDIGNWPHLQDVVLSQISDKTVSLLIGTDVPEAHWVTEQRLGGPRKPYASLTSLGWVILGPMIPVTSKAVKINVLSLQGSIDEDIVRMFDLDFSEGNHMDKSMSVEEKMVWQNAAQNTKLVNGQYEVPVLWKLNCDQISSNYVMAMKRLQYLKTRMLKDEALLSQYNKVLVEYEQKGYITRLSARTSDKLRFLPHHPVLNPRKPGKLRIVFDGAAKCSNVSLNDCLYTGPHVTNDLTAVLLRFRLHAIAMSADIQEMFLRVRLPPADRRHFCFFWFPDGDIQRDPVIYQFNVHPFGATSSPFCATYALQRTADDNKDLFNSLTVSTVKRNFYVDDCLVSVESAETASRLAADLSRLLSLGGFRLHKWVCNNHEVLTGIPESERSMQPTELHISESIVQKTLGLRWSVKDDCFTFNVDLPNKRLTKRGILSSIASLYDPLGFVAPLLLRPKRLLQKLCQTQCGWDEQIDAQTEVSWRDWRHEMQQLESLKIPRMLKPNDCQIRHTSLHVFSDASEEGYGAVAYLRCVADTGTCYCRFVLGKSRVTPLKPITIPRLELQAAVLSVKLMCRIKSEIDLKIDAFHLWTDSTIVLHYIRNTKSRFKTFVANRIAYIHEHSEVFQWRHVPTKNNPADLASRGIIIHQHSQLVAWLNGPDFLLKEEVAWPNIDAALVCDGTLDIEVKGGAKILAMQSSDGAFDRFLSYHSSWFRLLSSVAWMTRFKLYLSAKVNRRRTISVGPLQVREMRCAEVDILRYVQCKSFPEVSKMFSADTDATETVVRHTSLRKLSPSLVNGLICVSGRVRLSSTSMRSNYPIIIPDRHPVTTALINCYHQLEGHMGATHVLASLRQQYWIIHGLSAVKRVIGRCLPCREQSARPSEQIMAELPEARVTTGYPFAVTGVDFFGPFYIRERRLTKKRYGCIFTCLKIRAVHLEVTHALSIDSFLMALSRFINRRGSPREMYSDRGSNFVGAELELRKFVESTNDDEISKALRFKGIEWHFNPPYGSHRGGVWERQIRSVRRVLSAVSREQTLTDESLLTFMSEVERIINNRPLTPVCDDPHQLDVLTPNHLLLLHEHAGLPENHVYLRDRYTRHWKQGQLVADMFWRRWMREYLPLLRLRHKWMRVRRDFRIGDYVLHSCENATRGNWKKAIVSSVLPGADGHVRQVVLRTTSGEITRDIRRVYLLEGVEDQ